jgi:hypothetical protein
LQATVDSDLPELERAVLALAETPAAVGGHPSR